ncbi:MAG: non-homologous end-joining DNA ligase, partial [Leifsonia sp.]
YSPAAKRRYDPVPPREHEAMLAKAGSIDDIDDRSEWAVEMKWDGIRAIATVEGDEVRLMTRRHNDVTDQYPELAALTRVAHVRSGVFDGEIVATDAGGRPDFGLLQERMNLTKPAEIAAAMARRPVRLLLFDVLELDGDDLTGLDYTARRVRLERAVDAPTGSAIAVPEAFDADARTALEASRELGLEGVLAKERSSRYEEGRRSGAWIKIKHLATQEVVIGGWRPGRGHRAGTFGSLLMAVPSPDGLRYVGRVGTGFRDRDLARIADRLAPIGRETSPLVGVPAEDAADARWVEPLIVGEVEYTERTRTGSLRHPTWRGLRPDKDPADVSPE